MSQIINLYGGPGTGKSTSAAYLYYRLKQMGKNVELVREYVKDWAWENRKIGTYDQFYILGKQMHRETLLYGKADWIVTDSPALMTIVYARQFSSSVLARAVETAATALYQQAEVDGHKHHHVFLRRSKAYNSAGRYQTEEQAVALDHEIFVAFATYTTKQWTSETDPAELDKLLERLLAQ